MEYTYIEYPYDKTIQGFINNDKKVKQFYGNLNFDNKGIQEVLKRPTHAHTEKLAAIIEEEMEPLGLTNAQKDNLQKLKEGNRVIIGGQQAGLLVSPAYILHKVYSILTLVKDVKDGHNYDAVPVFWIAGEDHDFEEVNHTYVYDSTHKRMKKIAYKPNLNVQMSMGFYEYDKAEMTKCFKEILYYVGDSSYLKELKPIIFELIESCTYWTELFTAMIHELFKDTGLLIVNSHSKNLRALEIPIFECIIKESDAIDKSFKSGQKKFVKALNETPTIQTDASIHLFKDSTTKRTLIKGEIDTGALMTELHEKPHEFSNNVVTRPIMQESLFNTLMFVGGTAEIKYWGELHEVFKTLEVPMPIIVKRMEFMHVPKSISKKMDAHGLKINKDLPKEIQELQDGFVDREVDASVMKSIDSLKDDLDKSYKKMLKKVDGSMQEVFQSNLNIQHTQLDYLKRRYYLETKKKLRQELKDLDVISVMLYPDGVLQERKYHALQFLHNFREFPPLSYHSEIIIIDS